MVTLRLICEKRRAADPFRPSVGKEFCIHRQALQLFKNFSLKAFCILQQQILMYESVTWGNGADAIYEPCVHIFPFMNPQQGSLNTNLYKLQLDICIHRLLRLEEKTADQLENGTQTEHDEEERAESVSAIHSFAHESGQLCLVVAQN